MKQLALFVGVVFFMFLGEQALSAVQPGGYTYATQPRYFVFPTRDVDARTLERQSMAGLTVPIWTRTIKSPLDGKTYTYPMVGSSPFAMIPASTTVKYRFLTLIFRYNFNGNWFTFDPTKPSIAIRFRRRSAYSILRFFEPMDRLSQTVRTSAIRNSPMLSNEPSFGRRRPVQTTTCCSRNALPGVNLGAIYTITVPTDKGSLHAGSCGLPGLLAIDMNWFDGTYRNLLQAHFSRPKELPVEISYDVEFTVLGQCCFPGYRNSFILANGGTQTYEVASYFDQFTEPNGFGDISAMSHELGEWMNDPFVSNATPAWSPGGTYLPGQP